MIRKIKSLPLASRLAICLPMMVAIAMPMAYISAASTSLSSNAPKSQQNSTPALIKADNMSYNKDTDEAIAEGHVEIYKDKRILLADKVIYNRAKDTMRAIGNVSILEVSGDVFFAKEVEIKNDIKQTVAQEFKARMMDGSLLASKTATRNGLNDTMTMQHAVYSPCPICIKTEPQWQMKGGSVLVDEPNQKMTYHNAFFEVYGVPIFYTPYFSHATPNADRQSGFLPPTYSSITSLGSTVKIPYYVNIAPNMDATLTTFLTSDEGPVLIGSFRDLTENGEFELMGSITHPSNFDAAEQEPGNSDIRGHIEGKGKFDLTDDWSTGFDFKRASDDTYLARYRFGTEDFLTSEAWIERLEERNYLTVEAVTFQDLLQTTQADTPLVAPLIQSHTEKQTGFYNSTLTLDTNSAIINRDQGADSRHFIATGGWNIPYVTDNGQVFNIRSSIRGDDYTISGQPVTTGSTTSDFNGDEERLIPEEKIDWRYPLMDRFSKYNWVIEPRANVIVSPYGNNDPQIPNEDSNNVELTDTNLFLDNRFAGVDRVETGPRTNYGIESTLKSDDGEVIDGLLGQSYRAKRDPNLVLGSGLDKNFSDYVGRIGFSPNSSFDIAYRFRLDGADFDPHRNEITSDIKFKPFTFNISYISTDQNLISDTVNNTPTPINDRDEIYGAASWALSKQWTIKADARKNLENTNEGGGMISSGEYLQYHGDCADIDLSIVKQYTQDLDVQPSTSITFEVYLKNVNKPPTPVNYELSNQY